MNCPHCDREIPDEEIARHLAAKGGRRSKRVLTSKAARAMGRRRVRLSAATVDRIRELRGAGASLRSVAEQCGVSESTVSRIARGKRRAEP